MDYLSTDANPRGEICVKGPPVIKDYYKNDAKTKEAIDEDGWLHTGDIGMILPTGGFKVIDRKKNIFKLQQGEYVAPEKVENIYVKIPYINEAFVHGDSLQNHCVGFFTIDPVPFVDFCKGVGINGNVEELCKNEQAIQALWEDLYTRGKKENLYGFEQVKQLWLINGAFQELNLLTDSFKLKRFQAKKHFAAEIEQMYSLPPRVLAKK